MKSKIIISAFCLALCMLSACSDVDLPDTPQTVQASDVSISAEGRRVTMHWALPAGAGITAVRVYRNSSLLATLPADATSYTIDRDQAGENVYTVKLEFADGQVSQGVSCIYTLQVPPAKPALIVPAASEADITDDDEAAALAWFKTTYPDGVILTADKIKDLDPDNFACIWINIDREDLDAGWRKLPKAVSGSEPVAELKKYLALGGNLFLTKHAVQMTVPTGIQTALFAPGIFSSGTGGEGTDNWAFNANIGLNYDHRGHDIFRGLATLPDYGHETFAMEGPGHREDHNCMWDLNSYGLDPNPNTVIAFELENNCTVLGTWAHVTDYAVAGIVEFHATEARPGRCLAIGLSAYEFHQNTGNPFQANIELLTKNCIDYLLK